MNNSYITVSSKPFGTFLKLAKIDSIDYSNRTVAPSSEKYKVHLRVIQHILKVRSPLFISTRILMILVIYGISQLYFVTPFGQGFLCMLNIFTAKITCRTSNAYCIARIEIRRSGS